MKQKKERITNLVLFGVLVIVVMILIASRGSFRITPEHAPELTLNQAEHQFLEKKDTVTLYTTSALQYLEQEFLQEYVQSILEPTGLNVKVTAERTGAEDADGYLMEMTNELRNQVDQLQYSAPLFQTTGSLFVKKELAYGTGTIDCLEGVMIRSPLTDRQLQSLSYDGSAVFVQRSGSVAEGVDLAKKKDLDCIIGNQEAIVHQLKKRGMQDDYIDTDSRLYQQNVCVVTEKENLQFSNLVNKCIQSADKHLLLLHAEQKLGKRFSNLLEENRYGNMAALLSIIIIAVFITFYLYYESNKNMYDELAVRMAQLTVSKKEMQTTFNGISYYMAELDPDGYIMDMNRAFLNYVKKDCLGRHISQVIPFRDETKDTMERLLDAVKKNEKRSVHEIYFENSVLEVEGFPIDDPKGNLEKILLMIKDVTGSRMAERQMLQDNKMIAVGQLAAGVAHEIRNPLGVIRNYCYVLKTMDDAETKKKAIEVIERSVTTSGKIIDNLLNFSRISDKTVESFYLKTHIDNLLLLNEGKLKKKGITVEVECREDLVVKLPPESFDMILLNLISNGIDAMEAGGSMVISVIANDTEFKVLVTDTGCGIKEELLDEIFNPFFTTKYKTEGNGLGLYIVYNELTKMNGTIEVVSKVNEGTTFTVTLPVRLEGGSDE